MGVITGGEVYLLYLRRRPVVECPESEDGLATVGPWCNANAELHKDGAAVRGAAQDGNVQGDTQREDANDELKDGHGGGFAIAGRVPAHNSLLTPYAGCGREAKVRYRCGANG